ncbi:hypothetical protein BDV95DRAFT_591600 [Massariosphaeria phaeospora]|uniref:Uncharacterized protein n=1 Tax=Massariosphaeria phaeospora TaxID=100035 RepID=A0A7C8ICU2_9PLEO|nr:hypothetical protein BDV95DRAFT_591600 [Massariosphaeria phaeospora]
MAGTRRHSRTGSAANAQRLCKLSTSLTAMTVHNDADAEVEADGTMAVEVAESIDNGSPRPQSPASRSTTGFCRRCLKPIGQFFNSWHKVTGTYYLPAMLGSYTSSLAQRGKQKAASVGTDLDGCLIQPLACPSCSETLGFTAVDAPAKKQAFRNAYCCGDLADPSVAHCSGRDFFKLPRIELRCDTGPDGIAVVEPQVEDAREPLAVDDSDSASPSPVPVSRRPADVRVDMEVDARPRAHAGAGAAHPPPPPSGPHHARHEQHQQPAAPQHHHQHGFHHHHHHQQQQQQHPQQHPLPPLQPAEGNRRQSLPPPQAQAIRSPPTSLLLHALPQKSPNNPPLPSPAPAVQPLHDVQYAAPPPSQEAGVVGLANRSRDLPPVRTHPAEHRTANGQFYPQSPQEAQLDFVARLQTQISQNSSALTIHGRDMRRYEESLDGIRREFQGQLHQQNVEIRRVDEAVGRLQHEMASIRELFDAPARDSYQRRDVQTSRALAPGAAAPPISAQDSALELMAQQVAVVSQKATEVDSLKLVVEILRNKIQRLEDTAATAVVAAPPAVPQSAAQSFQSPRDLSAHSAHSSHTIPAYHATPSNVPHINTPVHPVHRQQSFHSHGTQSAVATPDGSQRVESTPTPSGWVTVNAAKRTHSIGMDGAHDPLGQRAGSPKRPKLAPIEPRAPYASSQHSSQQHVYDQMDTDDSDARAYTQSHTLPSQQPRHSIGESTLAMQHLQSSYAPYTTQDAPSEDSWRPESQRIAEHRTPRGRGRGGGPGSRGGRGRKSLPAQVHQLGTPEWEREDWQGVPDSQISPDGYYNAAGRSRGIIRRGSGGGGGTSRGGRPPSSSGRSVSLGMQGVAAGVGIGMLSDPYAHTKKTRTKPIRNADGVLIRKDGRPDMRSQSSAANLRKVHARKDDPRGSEGGFTPTSSLQYSTGMATETPSPTSYLAHDVTASVQKKHNAIMGKMFPGGIDEATKEHDYARKVFEEDQEHTPHSRNQHHQHHHTHHDPPAAHSPLSIKREQVEERRLADLQSPDNADVDMDRPEDHADDEGQTPSDDSGPERYHDAANHIEQPQQQQHPPQDPVANGVPPPPPPQSTAQTSQTLDVAPAQSASA